MGHRQLLWCATSFSPLALDNLLLVADRIVSSTYDLWAWRQLAGLA